MSFPPRAGLLLLMMGACGRLRFDPNDNGAGANDAPVVGGFDARPGIDANVVFVSDPNVMIGSLGQLTAADAACQATADAAKLPGTYAAWLSSSTTNAIDRIRSARGWVRPDGAPFADTAQDIAAGRIYYTASLDANGRDVGQSYVATGTLANGTVATATCNDYSSTTGTVRSGLANGGGGFFTDAYMGTCTGGVRVYCFGISVQAVVEPPTAPPARRAFLSSAWFPGAGLADADAHCTSDAAALGGTFAALLATSTASAASRFSTIGAPWVRLDGVPLAATAMDLLVVGPTQPLNLTAQGTYVGSTSDVAWGGSVDTVSANNLSTCSNWSVFNNGTLGYIGQPAEADRNWFSGTPIGCGMSARLYCLER